MWFGIAVASKQRLKFWLLFWQLFWHWPSLLLVLDRPLQHYIGVSTICVFVDVETTNAENFFSGGYLICM